MVALTQRNWLFQNLREIPPFYHLMPDVTSYLYGDSNLLKTINSIKTKVKSKSLSKGVHQEKAVTGNHPRGLLNFQLKILKRFTFSSAQR